MLIGSDGHYWPGAASTAHKAFVHFIKQLQPKIIIYNGDVADFPRISRHPSIGWSNNSAPTVEEELQACQLRMKEIEDASGRNAKLAWTLGNHDIRFESRLATAAPEYARVKGFELSDHFSPRWKMGWIALVI
jgi:metallophosphoesterase superfamily enzyme